MFEEFPTLGGKVRSRAHPHCDAENAGYSFSQYPWGSAHQAPLPEIWPPRVGVQRSRSGGEIILVQVLVMAGEGEATSV